MNPFEQPSVLGKPQKQDMCEHGNPKGLCEICGKKMRFEDISEWKTKSALGSLFDIGPHIVQRVADDYRQSHPEYFMNKNDLSGKKCEHYSPELIEIIKREISRIEEAPDDWKTCQTLANELGIAKQTVQKVANQYRESNPEYFKRLKTRKNQIFEHFSPLLIGIINSKLTTIEKSSDGWKTMSGLADDLKVSKSVVKRVSEKYRDSNPEFFKEMRDWAGNVREHYSPELIKLITDEFAVAEQIPENWKTCGAIAAELGVSPQRVERLANSYRGSNPEYFKKKTGQIFEFFSSDLIDIIKSEITEISTAPGNWKTRSSLSDELNLSAKPVDNIVDQYRRSNPEYFRQYRHPVIKKIFEYISPELVEKVISSLSEVKSAPIEWETAGAIAKKFNIGGETAIKIADQYRRTNPEYFQNFKVRGSGKISEHYHPDLIKIIKDDLEKRGRRINVEEERLKQSLEDFFQEISDPETADERARKIRAIMKLLPENACDILLRYHPEYSGLKNEYVKSVIADYLGDFLLVRKTWEPKDIEMAGELFSEERFAEALFIKFKEASFAYYQKEKRNVSEGDDHDLIMGYFEQAELVQAAERIPEVQQTIDRLKEYYEDLFRRADKKPGNVVDNLKEGRVFPDINQLINIKEIADNGKMLIADEMGLGKSASVILAKEYLGLKCAVVVMPSNVEDTWKTYLSDTVDDKRKQRGYFKKGASPKVLTIESKADLERLRNESFDYILISQEKMSQEHYVKALEEVDFDMLITDEVHKLKNIEEGIRSENAVRLAEKIQGEEKYLAMLSGTPMPNKVKDLAIILKLLYPEKYKDTDDKALIERIIYGDMADLRQELFSRMQMKGVETSIEIPPLVEEPDIEIELTEEEKEVYQILLEEDELTASEKIIIFRKFLLNPQLLGMEPDFEGSKIKALREALAEDLKTKKRIIVWVNGYIDGVIRPESDEKGTVITEDIIGKLGLPENTAWIIHGEDRKKKQYRQKVQKLFNGDGPEKMVLFVSGSAADVGVDFSGADAMIHYNEPWSKYDKKQQEGRAHREGQRGRQTVKTLIAKGTIEEGMRRYTDAKERAIEKLLRGLDRTEAENELLRKDAVSRKKDVESDKDLSRDYTSDWEKLMLHFGQGWQAGEEWFRHMPEEEKESYARLYWGTRRLSYQGNNARVSATLLEKMIADQGKSGERLRILDIASGPEMLKRCVREDLRDQIYSMDINGKHFETALDERRTFEKSYLNLPVRSESVDYYNIGFAFHQTKPVKFYKKNYERLQVLAEMNRVLKIGGLAVISEIHNAEFEDPEALKEVLTRLGMRIVKGYSGEADGGENYQAHFLTLEKIAEIDGYGKEAFALSETEKRQKVRELGDELGKELIAGLRIKKLPKGASKLEDQRRMIDNFRLGGQEFGIRFTDEDRKLFDEEKKSIEDGEALKKRFGGRVDDIPLSELYKIGFKRKLRNPNLMYRIVENGGVIVVRGDRA